MKHLFLLFITTCVISSCSNNETHNESTATQQDWYHTESTITYPADFYTSTIDNTDSQATVADYPSPTVSEPLPTQAEKASQSKAETWHDYYSNRSKEWNEGYDKGYDDGYEDSDTGDYGDRYNSKCRYKGKKRKEYKDGYASGYQDGYEAGNEDEGIYDYDY